MNNLFTRVISCTRIVETRGTAYCRKWKRLFHSDRCCQAKSSETELVKQLKSRIKIAGPVSVASYMKEALSNPVAGYYMHKDVFGIKGDFTTSPEVNQVFGELIGIWCVNEWMRIGRPEKLQVVELGPGRGTLAFDMMRVFSQFPALKKAVSLHLVETSPKLSEIQKEKLIDSSGVVKTSTEMPWYQQCNTVYGQEVSWYKSIQAIPRGLTFFVANEFFDALPVLVFHKSDRGWREMFIDVDETDQGPHHLRFVLAAQETVTQRAFLKVDDTEKRDHLEISPESGLITEVIAKRIAEDGGFGLMIDYGHNGDQTDTIRAFRNHELHDILCEPGKADITADVDFSYLRKIAEKYVTVHGPITQRNFLHDMGIIERLTMLVKKASPEEIKNHETSYTFLTHPEKMGERFKVLCLMPKKYTNYVPAGFVPLKPTA